MLKLDVNVDVDVDFTYFHTYAMYKKLAFITLPSNLMITSLMRKCDVRGLRPPTSANSVHDLTFKIKSSSLVLLPLFCKQHIFGF